MKAGTLLGMPRFKPDGSPNRSKRAFAAAIPAFALLLSVAALPAMAQNFSLLHTFAPGGFKNLNTFTNADGVQPTGGLVLSGGTRMEWQIWGVAEALALYSP